ncbi:MAG: hypothetical protein RR936_08225 [Carnobacterium sp.]|uniref:hypothetical protein n=1 Tax=Carnobacterium sp. TaxID=48221 RepID=UPI002FC81603
MQVAEKSETLEILLLGKYEEIAREEARILLAEIVNKLDEEFLCWDIKKMAEKCCLSVSSVRRYITNDKRMKLLEKKPNGGKAIWPVEQARETILEIVSEW